LIQEARREQYEKALEIDKHRLNALKEASIKRIDVEKDTLIFQIRAEYIRILNQLGVHVEEQQLNFMADFGEKITVFKRKLAQRDIAPAQKKKIKEMADHSFDRLFEKLNALTLSLVDSAAEK
jgi:hypothetical protein